MGSGVDKCSLLSSCVVHGSGVDKCSLLSSCVVHGLPSAGRLPGQTGLLDPHLSSVREKTFSIF